jgi:hypothetical protein
VKIDENGPYQANFESTQKSVELEYSNLAFFDIQHYVIQNVGTQH